MSMMNEQSKQALAAAFRRAVKAGLVRAEADSFDIAPIPDALPATRRGERVLVITTSSFTFRLLTLFHFSQTPEGRAYYCDDASEEKVEAAFSERVNLCCGALNRELSHHFPHLGMSIPYFLADACLENLGEMKPEFLSRFAITLNAQVRIEATLCMSCSAPVEVPVLADVGEERTGELELF